MEVSESPSVTPAEPSSDHPPSANSINDQLDALSFQPDDDTKIDADNKSDRDVAYSELMKIEEILQEEQKHETDVVAIVIDNEKVDDNDGGGNEKEREIEVVGEWDGENNRRIRFPVRPEAEKCSFYLRTGMCKFGMNCKYNHPPNWKYQDGKVKGKEEYLDGASQWMREKNDYKDEQIDCKYFDRPGGCKFGKACKFNHSRKTTSTGELNFMGLPIRLGERECPYYMRTGSCKFGASCKFNHPDPTTSIGGSNNRLGNSNGGSILSPNASQSTLGSWSPAALSESPPYVPLMFPPAQVVPPQPEWRAYQASVYPPERSMQLPSAYATNNQQPERNAYMHQQQQTLLDEYPERPGQPECNYFLKTGNCKFRSACKFHHPRNDSAKSTSCTLSNSGLPLRPGQSVCSYYNRYGICKFGPACKYDHPTNHALSIPMGGEAEDENSASGDSVENDQAATEVTNEILIQQSA